MNLSFSKVSINNLINRFSTSLFPNMNTTLFPIPAPSNINTTFPKANIIHPISTTFPSSPVNQPPNQSTIPTSEIK